MKAFFNAAARGLAGITVLALVFTSIHAVSTAVSAQRGLAAAVYGGIGYVFLLQQQLASLESVAASVRELSTLGARMFDLLHEGSVQDAAPAADPVAVSRRTGS
jgi:ABC-type multidrug transport system fused ATPase/permease subunit